MMELKIVVTCDVSESALKFLLNLSLILFLFSTTEAHFQ